MLAAALLLVSAATAQESRPPNVVYVLADDLGYGELGCYGQERIRTPHLDRMAAEGMRFTQHYSGAPVCAPARCVLLTGKHSGHATIRDNLEHQPEGQAPILDGDVTIAEVLRGAGYATGCFGKWGLVGTFYSPKAVSINSANLPTMPSPISFMIAAPTNDAGGFSYYDGTPFELRLSTTLAASPDGASELVQLGGTITTISGTVGTSGIGLSFVNIPSFPPVPSSLPASTARVFAQVAFLGGGPSATPHLSNLVAVNIID